MLFKFMKMEINIQPLKLKIRLDFNEPFMYDFNVDVMELSEETICVIWIHSFILFVKLLIT